MSSSTVAPKGLDGVVVASTNISHVFGEEGRLVYRGYEIDQLAANVSYEEVCHLLWKGRLPNTAELAELNAAEVIAATDAAGALIDEGTWRRAQERGAEHEKMEGLKIARELAQAIAGIARGLHLMPMGKYALAAEILDALPRRETKMVREH